MTVATVTVQGVQCTLADTATAAVYGPYVCTCAAASGTPAPVFPTGARAIPIDVPSTNPITVTSTTPGNAATAAAGYLAALQVPAGSLSWTFLQAACAGQILQAWAEAGGALVSEARA